MAGGQTWLRGAPAPRPSVAASEPGTDFVFTPCTVALIGAATLSPAQATSVRINSSPCLCCQALWEGHKGARKPCCVPEVGGQGQERTGGRGHRQGGRHGSRVRACVCLCTGQAWEPREGTAEWRRGWEQEYSLAVSCPSLHWVSGSPPVCFCCLSVCLLLCLSLLVRVPLSLSLSDLGSPIAFSSSVSFSFPL